MLPSIRITDETGREWLLAYDPHLSKVAEYTSLDEEEILPETKKFIDRVAQVLKTWSEAQADQTPSPEVEEFLEGADIKDARPVIDVTPKTPQGRP